MSEPAVLVGQRTRSRIAPFRLHRPTSVADAVAAMAAAPAGAAYMAGGIDLVNRMKCGYAPADVVHLGRVPELATIDETGSGLRIGACATHRAIVESAIVLARAPMLARCWRTIAHPRVRCKGTVGGNVMARESAYDVTLMLLAAGAVLTYTADGSTSTDVPIEDGVPDDALLTAIHLPEPGGLSLRVDASLHPALKIVFGARRIDGRLSGARLAIGGAYAQPYVTAIEAGAGMDAAAIAAAVVERLPAAVDDWRASADYRKRMMRVLLQRVLEQESAGR